MPLYYIKCHNINAFIFTFSLALVLSASEVMQLELRIELERSQIVAKSCLFLPVLEPSFACMENCMRQLLLEDIC